MDESKSLQQMNEGLSPSKRKRFLPSTGKSDRHTLDVEALAAAWLLFQFSKKKGETKATHTIRTLLPNKALRVVKIEVESLAIERDEEGKEHRLGLPGAFAQDIFVALLDMVTEQIRLKQTDLLDRVKDGSAESLQLSKNDIRVRFRNKDLAERMNLTSKNARITDALNQLHKTHIKIDGCVYFNGKEERIQHNTYYLPTFTSVGQIRRNEDPEQWHSAVFDDVLVGNVVKGYVARLNQAKLLNLPSGAPRKLYTLLAAKQASAPGDSLVSITESEVRGSLRIEKKNFRSLSRKYYEELRKANIIAGYELSNTQGESVVTFQLVSEGRQLLTDDVQSQVAEYFELLRKYSITHSNYGEVMKKQFNVNCENLTALMKKHKEVEMFSSVAVPRPILWADMILFAMCTTQKDKIRNPHALLVSLLKAGTPPSVGADYKPTHERLRKIEADLQAKLLVQTENETRARQEELASEMAKTVWEGYSKSQKERVVQTIKEYTPSLGLFMGTDKILHAMATEMISGAIKEGVVVNEPLQMLKWYEERKRLEGEV